MTGFAADGRSRRKWYRVGVLSTTNGRVAVVLLLLLLVLAVIAPYIWGDQANRIDTDSLLQGPSSHHLLGTDGLGRDMFARILVATRRSLVLAVLAVGLAAVVGLTLGVLPLVLGRTWSRLVTGFINVMIAFPGVLTAIFFAVIFGVGARGAVLALGLTGAPVLARLTSTLGASVANADFVAAARLLGVSRLRLATRHVLPNVAEPLILNLTIGIGQALLAVSALSFLGLGVQPPDYDWGRLLNEGLNRIYVSPLSALAPGIAIVIAGLCFNFLGEALAQLAGRSATAGQLRSRAAAGADELDDGLRLTTVVGGEPVLVVRDLTVGFPSEQGDFFPVHGLNLTIHRGEIVGLVGESGSGKTLTSLAISQLVPSPGWSAANSMSFLGHDVGALGAAERRRVLGTSMPMVFQSPATTLNPVIRIGRQLAEVVEVHDRTPRRLAMERAAAKLRAVAIPDAERRLRAYPHEFSGGMKQRAVIAMGLMGRPRLFIADEPTTALDVTVQHQIFALMRDINRESQASILLVSHDVVAVAELCTRVVVMYAGRIVEELSSADLAAPLHPYTRALVAAVPSIVTDRNLPLATIPGQPPHPRQRITGCPFAPRCARADDTCVNVAPDLVAVDVTRSVACWHPLVPAEVAT